MYQIIKTGMLCKMLNLVYNAKSTWIITISPLQEKMQNRLKGEHVLTSGIYTPFLPCITTHVIHVATHTYTTSQKFQDRLKKIKNQEFQI